MANTTRRWLQDVLLALVVAGALGLRAASPWEAGAPPPDLGAYTLMVAIGALLLARRRHPLGVLYGSVAILMVYYTLGYGAVGAVWPVAPALFNAALYGKAKPAALTAGFIVAGSTAWRAIFEPEEQTLAMLSDVLTETFVAVAVVLGGAMVLNHRLLRAEMEARERAVAAERDAEARSRLTEQRLHIAREVHDIVAHSLAAIGVQARLADEVLDSDAAEARRSIRSIIAATSDAIGQLRATVGGLRSTPATAPSIKEIIDSMPGLDVELVVDGLGPPPEGEAEAVIRSVVREALTNVVRHSGVSTARVGLHHYPDTIQVEVTDEGSGGEFTAGHGIDGMRERVESAGGSLEVGSTRAGGFRVTARVPR